MHVVEHCVGLGQARASQDADASRCFSAVFRHSFKHFHVFLLCPLRPSGRPLQEHVSLQANLLKPDPHFQNTSGPCALPRSALANAQAQPRPGSPKWLMQSEANEQNDIALGAQEQGQEQQQQQQEPEPLKKHEAEALIGRRVLKVRRALTSSRCGDAHKGSVPCPACCALVPGLQRCPV